MGSKFLRYVRVVLCESSSDMVEQGLLIYDPAKRISAKRLLLYPYFSDYSSS